jgi:hypothetical protein
MPNQKNRLNNQPHAHGQKGDDTLPETPTAKSLQEVITDKQHLHRGIRYTISDAAVLTVTDAAEILPGRCSTNREWSESNVEKIYSPSMRVLYRWGDIVAAMKEAA